ncbi:MAG: glycosyltransferase, partial [Spirochaetaceae bacterium]
ISPLFGMEYAEFVRGCHLGIFPRYYEPWGYTPLECVSSGIPAVTSNLSGFGDYVQKTMKVPRRKGLYVLNRKNRSYQESARDLARFLLDFAKHGRRERIELRNRTEAAAPLFDWERLIKHYQQAYTQALR